MMQGEGNFVRMRGAPGNDALELDGILGDSADFHQLGFDNLRVSHRNSSMAHVENAVPSDSASEPAESSYQCILFFREYRSQVDDQPVVLNAGDYRGFTQTQTSLGSAHVFHGDYQQRRRDRL